MHKICKLEIYATQQPGPVSGDDLLAICPERTGAIVETKGGRNNSYIPILGFGAHTRTIQARHVVRKSDEVRHN